MSKLSELHDAVKLHPYRSGMPVDHETQIDYKKALEDMAHEFWSEYVNGKDSLLYNYRHAIGFGFYHDFMSTIYRRRGWDSDDILHLERCIATIHRLIDTGKVEEFWSYYTGVNIEKSLSRHRRYIFIESQDKYVPVFTEKELVDVLKEYEDYIARGNVVTKYSMPYGLERLEHFKEYYAEMQKLKK